MAKLLSAARNSLAKGDFALSSERAYPIEDKAHAKDAKARASEEYNKGNLSKGKEEEIDRKADAKLGKKGKSSDGGAKK